MYLHQFYGIRFGIGILYPLYITYPMHGMLNISGVENEIVGQYRLHTFMLQAQKLLKYFLFMIYESMT